MHLQQVRDKYVIYVAILEEKTDDFNRRFYHLQLEGSKTALELPGQAAAAFGGGGRVLQGLGGHCRDESPLGRGKKVGERIHAALTRPSLTRGS
jgi:hypothetical protein